MKWKVKTYENFATGTLMPAIPARASDESIWPTPIGALGICEDLEIRWRQPLVPQHGNPIPWVQEEVPTITGLCASPHWVGCDGSSGTLLEAARRNVHPGRMTLQDKSDFVHDCRAFHEASRFFSAHSSSLGNMRTRASESISILRNVCPGGWAFNVLLSDRLTQPLRLYQQLRQVALTFARQWCTQYKKISGTSHRRHPGSSYILVHPLVS